MPSGISYAVAAREQLADLPALSGDPAPVDGAFERLGAALRAAAPPAADEPTIVLLSTGSAAAGWYEHVRVGRELGSSVVTLADLERDGGEVVRREGDRAERVDVVYLRTNEDRFTEAEGGLTAIGELLLEPCVAGRVACVNAPGSGIGDDKLVHAYVEEMIRFYLGEDPVLDSVRDLRPRNRLRASGGARGARGHGLQAAREDGRRGSRRVERRETVTRGRTSLPRCAGRPSA